MVNECKIGMGFDNARLSWMFGYKGSTHKLVSIEEGSSIRFNDITEQHLRTESTIKVRIMARKKTTLLTIGIKLMVSF